MGLPRLCKRYQIDSWNRSIPTLCHKDLVLPLLPRRAKDARHRFRSCLARSQFRESVLIEHVSYTHKYDLHLFSTMFISIWRPIRFTVYHLQPYAVIEPGARWRFSSWIDLKKKQILNMAEHRRGGRCLGREGTGKGGKKIDFEV